MGFKFRAIFLMLYFLPLLWAHAENRVILFGGVDEQHPENNIFIESMGECGSAYRRAGWNVHAYFSGIEQPRRRTLMDRMARSLQMPSSRIREARRDSLFGELERATQTMTEGSQLLIHINAHGIPGAFETEEGHFAYENPRLQVVLAQLQRRGIRLGFVIDACCSGTAIAAFSRFGCVMTSAAADSTGSGPGEVVVGLDQADNSARRNLSVHTPAPFSHALANALNLSSPRDSLSLSDVFESELFYQSRDGTLDLPQMTNVELDDVESVLSLDTDSIRLVMGQSVCTNGIDDHELHNFEQQIQRLANATQNAVDLALRRPISLNDRSARTHLQEQISLEQELRRAESTRSPEAARLRERLQNLRRQRPWDFNLMRARAFAAIRRRRSNPVCDSFEMNPRAPSNGPAPTPSPRSRARLRFD